MAETSKDTPAKPGKAKVILPKVEKKQGGFHPGGQQSGKGGKGTAHAQNKPSVPRLPGRNG